MALQRMKSTARNRLAMQPQCRQPQVAVLNSLRASARLMRRVPEHEAAAARELEDEAEDVDAHGEEDVDPRAEQGGVEARARELLLELERSEALGCAERLERMAQMLLEESLDRLESMGYLQAEEGRHKKVSALAWR